MATGSRFSLIQVQEYAHSAGLFVARWNPEGGAYRFRVFDEDKPYLSEDWLFETLSLAEVAAFVRGYRKALAKFVKEQKHTEQGNGKKTSPKAPKKATVAAAQKAAPKQHRARH